MVAAYEADSQIAFLLKEGHADFAISEDSDLLAYGSKKGSHLKTLCSYAKILTQPKKYYVLHGLKPFLYGWIKQSISVYFFYITVD